MLTDSKTENLIFAETEREEPQRIALSDSESFSGLYQAHQKLVRSVIFQMTGGESLDDLVQDTFLQIWKGLPSFRYESRLSTWIYKVSVNRALDHLRHQKSRLLDRLHSVPIELSSGQMLDEELSNRDLVSKGLRWLSEEHRTVLVLSMLHDLGNSEISVILDVSEGTIKSRLHYAKINFRKFLSTHGVNI